MPSIREHLLAQLEEYGSNHPAATLLNAHRWQRDEIKQTVAPTKKIVRQQQKRARWAGSSRYAYSRDSSRSTRRED